MPGGNDNPVQGLLKSPFPSTSGLLVLLTLLGVVTMQFRTGRDGNSGVAPVVVNKGQESDSSDLDATTPVDHPPLQVLLDHFGLRRSSTAITNRELFDLSSALAGMDGGFQCLIATVPDPVDSHFQLLFDQALASLARGFERHQYVLDRFVLPWSFELERLKNKQSTAGHEPVYRQRPGALLFRRNKQLATAEGPTTELCLVLLVGEAPTFGVHSRAMRAALSMAADLTTTARLESQLAWRSPLLGYEYPDNALVPLRILGPTYSGSSISLRRSLEHWFADQAAKDLGSGCYEVQILSGSATSDDNVRRLKIASRRPPAASLDTRFTATVLPDSALLRTILAHLRHERGLPPHKIALLSESNTSYGAELTQGALPRGTSGHVPTLGVSRVDARIRILPFPMSLSRIRSEAERNSQHPSLGSKNPNPAERHNIDVALDADPYASDALPQYSRVTMASTDVILENILATIARDDIRAVGIMGTDVRDKLFLAREVHDHAPDVQLFFVESNVLLSHADYADTLRGSIVVSSYPLFARSQTWNNLRPVGHPTLVFPSDSDEGIYNATVALLNAAASAAGDPQQPLLDYAPVFGDGNRQRGPSVWLTMVGQRGLWPIAGRDVSRAEAVREYVALGPSATQLAPGVAPAQLQIPTGVAEPIVALVAATFGLIVMLINVPRLPGIEYVEPLAGALRRSFPWLVVDSLASAAMVYCLLGFATVLTVESSAAIGVYWLHFVRAGVRIPFAAAAAVSLFGAALLTQVAAATMVGRVISGMLHARGVPWHPDPSSPPSVANVWALAGVGTLGIALPLGAIAWYVNSWPTLDAAMFVERAGTLSSGVSPIAPLLLSTLALVFWAVSILRRRWLLRFYPMADPFGAVESATLVDPLEQAALGGFASRMADLRNSLSRYWTWFRDARDWYVVPLLALSLAYVAWRWIPTAEGPAFDLLFQTLGILGVFAAASQLARLQSVCRSFERLTRRMGQHPLSPVFGRVPERLAAKAAGQIFAAAPHPGDLEPLVQAVRRLLEHAAASGIAVSAEARRTADEIDLAYAHLVQLTPLDRIGVRQRGAELHARIARFCQNLLARPLARAWAGHANSGCSHEESEARKSWIADAELLIAMHMVDVIRQAFAHVQNLMTFLSAIVLSLLWCVNSYPFQPNNLLLSLSFGSILWTAVVAIVLLFRFNRDEVLSRLSQTTPNRFTLDRSLVLPLITYVAVPLLGLIATRFPTVSSGLFHWVDALQQILRG